jgi:preprotein translocase subunit SecF
LQRLARPLFRLVPDVTRIRFMRGAVAGLVVSGVLSTASLIGAFYPGLDKGIDFKGGIVMEVRTEQPADLARLRGALAGQSFGDVGLQSFGDDRTLLVRLPAPGQEGADPAGW